MEIEPIKLFHMLLFAFAFGGVCGVLNDLNRIIRVMLGARYVERRFDHLYRLRLPVVGRPLCDFDREKKGRIEGGAVAVIIFFQDVLLFIFGGVGVSVINYYFNSGRLRIYAPLAAIIGFTVYFFTVGRIVVSLGEIISFGIKAAFLTLFFIFYRPICYLIGVLAKKCKNVIKKFNKSIAKKQKMVYNNSKEKSVAENSQRGFLRFQKSKL